MVQTRIVCDLCGVECSDDPYGISLGQMNKPQETVHFHLCAKHFGEVTKTMYAALKSVEPSDGAAS